MIEHFLESKKMKELSFMEFIKEHYISGDGDESDNHRDMKLPFKTHESLSLTITAIPQLGSTPLLMLDEIYDELFFPEQKLIKSSYIATIWQPPKIS
jgi:hypothetical protein